MFNFHKIGFTDLYLNGKLTGGNSEGAINECDIIQRQGRWVEVKILYNHDNNLYRHYLGLTLTHDICLELDIEKSLTEFNVT